MTGSDKNGKKPTKPKQSGSREARLAAALRENLRRRKAQERARTMPVRPETGGSGRDDENS